MAGIPNRLRVVRAEKRKTQWAMVQATGINQSKLSLIENGYIEPSEEERALLAKALGVTESELFPAELAS